MEVLKEKDMKLLSRKRVVLMVDNNGATPSRSEMIKQVAKKYSTKPENVIIKHVYSQFGSTKTKIIVNIYSDSEKMKAFEHKNLIKKHEIKAEPKAEAAPVEAAPVEESNEEE